MAASKKDQDQDQAPDAGQTAQPAQATQKEYVVLHNGVGPWWQGQTLTDAHLRGIDVQRLLDVGAIAETQSDTARDATARGLAGTTPDGTPVTEPVPLPTTGAPPTPPEQTAGTVTEQGMGPTGG
jgi:hypothetical protein